MTAFGHLTVIKRNGTDGSRLPLTAHSCLIGRNEQCDIRVQLPNISQFHCRVDVMLDGQVSLINLSNVNPTTMNKTVVAGSALMQHNDVFTVGDRSFRWEFPPTSLFYNKSRVLLRNGVSPPSSNKRQSLKQSSNETERSLSSASVKAPSTVSPARKKRRLSLSSSFARKKVSFGPALSPEQFELCLPAATPIKKGGRPSSRRPSAPDYYGNPILTPVLAVERAKRSSSSSDLQLNNSKRLSKDRSSPVVNCKSSSAAKENASFSGGKSLSPAGECSGAKVSSESKSSSVRMLLGLENSVKIVAPASPDSKKSAALRTIHGGKLKLKKSKSLSNLASMRKKNKVRRHSAIFRRSSAKGLKVQMPFSRIKPTKVIGKKASLELENTSNSAVSPSEDYKSPNIPNEVFVSPLNTPNGGDAVNSSAVKRLLRKVRESTCGDSLNLSGLEPLMKTPSPSTLGKITRQTKSPFSDYTNVAGIKTLSKARCSSVKPDCTDVGGLKRFMITPRRSPRCDYSDVGGVKRLMRSSGKSPKCDYSDVYGLKRLMRTPQKSPKSDYSNVHGLKRIMKTPQRSPVADYTDVGGVDRLFGHSFSLRSGGIRSPVKLSASPDALEEVGSPATRTPKTPPSAASKRGLGKVLEFAGRMTRSVSRTPKRAVTSPSIQTPKSAIRGGRRLKKTSPSVVEVKSVSRSSFESKTPSPLSKGKLDNSRNSIGRNNLTPRKRSLTDGGIKSQAKTTPRLKTPPSSASRVDHLTYSGLLLPEFVGRITRSTGRAKRVATGSPSVQTPTIRRRAVLNEISPLAVDVKSLSTSHTVANGPMTPSSTSKKKTNRRGQVETLASVVAETPNKRAGLRKKAVTPVGSISPKAIGRRTKTPRKVAAESKVPKSPVEAEEVPVTPTNTRTRSKKAVTFVNNESEDNITPNSLPAKAKRGSRKKADSLGANTSPRQAVTTSPTSPVATSRREKSLKTDKATISESKKPRKKLPAAPKSTKAAVASPKAKIKAVTPQRETSLRVTRSSAKRNANV